MASRRSSDHPRVCGELGAMGGYVIEQSGSSPRVRGTQRVGGRTHFRRRIIPACAGNSCPCRRPRCFLPDHPRVCGELQDAQEGIVAHDGSSPRVRGTRIGFTLGFGIRRIIPACAGNSPLPAMHRATSTDHPRVCGELSGSRIAFGSERGSSPRVRGTLASIEHRVLNGRIIPACAGNSSRR